jgi:hypothetical protein
MEAPARRRIGTTELKVMERYGNAWAFTRVLIPIVVGALLFTSTLARTYRTANDTYKV